MSRRPAFLVACLAAASLASCTTRTIPAGDATIPSSDGAVVDAGRDAGLFRPDTGPPVDGGPRLDEVLIYAHSPDTLFTFSPFSNTVTEIGEFRTAGGGSAPDMLDLAVDSEGVVFTSSANRLWRVDVATAEVTEIGEFGVDGEQFFALSFLTPGQSPDGSEMLIGATNAGAYYQVDRDDASSDFLGQYPEGWISSGDIVSVDGLGIFATLKRDDFPSDVLAQITFSSSGASAVTVIGAIEDGPTGFTQIFGLGYWGRNVYGFTNAGQLIQIDRTSGDATVVSTTTGTDRFWGAGVTTQVPFLI